jgi:uncharacterized protein YbjT (DUF2867 family)
MIVVIGASGKVGSRVVRALRERGAPVRALVRARERGAAAEAAGAEIAIGDASDADALDAALAGAQRVFWALPAVPEQAELETNVVDAVVRAGSPPAVKLSVIAADPSSPVRFIAAHGWIEDLLGEAGVPHTLLRPNDFMQNAFAWAPMFADGTVPLPAADARIASVDADDVAAAAVAALTDDARAGSTYALTGPDAPTRREQVAILAAAAGREVEVVPVSHEEARQAMLDAGVPRWIADGRAELLAFYDAGRAATPAAGVREATGREPRGWSDFARDHAEAFAAPA